MTVRLRRSLLLRVQLTSFHDFLLAHGELNSSRDDVEDIQVRVNVVYLQYILRVEFLHPRVLRLQNVVLNVTRHSIHERQRCNFLGQKFRLDWDAALELSLTISVNVTVRMGLGN